MTDTLMLKTEQGIYHSFAKDERTDCSFITAVTKTSCTTVHDDHQEEDANFPVAKSEDCSRHTDLEELCSEHIDTPRLLLFQSSLDLFKDVRSFDLFKDGRGLEPKSEQVEVYYRSIKSGTIDETPKETPKPGAQMKKNSVLKSCLNFRVEQGTCSTDGDFTAELSLNDSRFVDFSEVTVRTFVCRLGDNPSTSK
jgi:hypothetical protein